MATGIGETLRAARREQGRSLADAAAETRVRETYLAALEQEDFTSIGGDVYAKGFLRSYAKALGLDPEPLLEAYRQEFGPGDTGVPVTSQPVEPVRSTRQPGMVVIVAAGGVVLLVLAVIGLLSDSNGPEEEASAPGPSPVETPEEPDPDTPPEDEEDPGSADEEDGGDTTDEGAEDAEDVEGLEVVVSVVDAASWLRVQVDGTTVIEGTRSEGFSEQFDGEEEIVVRVGDASAVTVEANGMDQGQLGTSGQVVVVTCAEGETDCDTEIVPT